MRHLDALKVASVPPPRRSLVNVGLQALLSLYSIRGASNKKLPPFFKIAADENLLEELRKLVGRDAVYTE